MWQTTTDSLQAVAPVADTVRTAAVAVKPQRKTVEQIIRSLPENATPAQQDSAVQAYFRIKEFEWTDSTRGDLPLGSQTCEDLLKREVNLYELRASLAMIGRLKPKFTTPRALPAIRCLIDSAPMIMFPVFSS